jgi:hypothetical protein
VIPRCQAPVERLHAPFARDLDADSAHRLVTQDAVMPVVQNCGEQRVIEADDACQYSVLNSEVLQHERHCMLRAPPPVVPDPSPLCFLELLKEPQTFHFYLIHVVRFKPPLAKRTPQEAIPPSSAGHEHLAS